MELLEVRSDALPHGKHNSKQTVQTNNGLHNLLYTVEFGYIWCRTWSGCSKNVSSHYTRSATVAMMFVAALTELILVGTRPENFRCDSLPQTVEFPFSKGAKLFSSK